jgi:hypothetical protein
VDLSHFDKQLEQALPLTEEQAREYAGNRVSSGDTSKTAQEWYDYFMDHVGQRIVYALVYRKEVPQEGFTKSVDITIERIWESDLKIIDVMYPTFTLHPPAQHASCLPRLVDGNCVLV